MSELRLKTALSMLACAASLSMPLVVTATPLAGLKTTPSPLSSNKVTGMSVRDVIRTELRRSGGPSVGLNPIHSELGQLVDVYIEDELEVTVSPGQLEDAIDFIIKERRDRRVARHGADDGDAGGCVRVAFATRPAGGRQVSNYVMIDCVNLR